MTKFSDTWKCSSVEQLRSEAIRRIHEIISYAKKTDREIQWSAEDAIHSDKDFLLSACRVAITSGATIINIPDTLGLALPWEIEDIFRFLTFGTEDLRSQGYSFIFSTHNHNDGGNAVANTLAAIRGGARQAECTINNIGERAGNASLSSIVGNIRERSRAIIPNVSCHVRCLPQAQYRLSQAVEAMTGIKSTPHTPFV